MSLADTKTRKAVVAGLMAAGCLFSAGSALAQAIVVRSTGPSAAEYPQGRKLPANASVTLRAGDRLTVLDKAGTRVLSGPGSFALNGAINRNETAGSALASLTVRTPGARVRTGAVRGAPLAASTAEANAPDSVWYVDVSKGGTFCVADPTAVVLWRPNRASEGAGKLLSADGSMADVAWKAGSALKLWPVASVPVVDGQSYTFSNPVGPTVKIRLKLLPSVPSEDMAVASVFADNGCNAQLDVIANSAAPQAAGG
ncbi:MAG: hypothetical protein ABT11_03495 [Novosphingobium sp. SCN 66-18]|nr:MAG: hypothetical protein ABT11_03495 [Novosphingobium sp. SCN 66-18]